MPAYWNDDEPTPSIDDVIACGLIATRRALRSKRSDYESLVEPVRHEIRVACCRHNVNPIQALLAFVRKLQPTYYERAVLVAAALDVIDEQQARVH